VRGRVDGHDNPAPVSSAKSKHGTAENSQRFRWGAPASDESKQRILKLMTVAYDTRAFIETKVKQEQRWRQVVEGVKRNNSSLFAQLRPHIDSSGSFTQSWRTLKEKFDDVYAAWKRQESDEARSSGEYLKLLSFEFKLLFEILLSSFFLLSTSSPS
jgi:hypothetical protein